MKSNPWATLRLLGKWAFAALFAAGGVGHFVATDGRCCMKRNA